MGQTLSYKEEKKEGQKWEDFLGTALQCALSWSLAAHEVQTCKSWLSCNNWAFVFSYVWLRRQSTVRHYADRGQGSTAMALCTAEQHWNDFKPGKHFRRDTNEMKLRGRALSSGWLDNNNSTISEIWQQQRAMPLLSFCHNLQMCLSETMTCKEWSKNKGRQFTKHNIEYKKTKLFFREKI